MQSVNIATSTTLSSRPAGTIRFLILSDTHDNAFPEYIPPVDVILHCGDMTMIGGLSNYKAAISSLSNCPAELKLVIPGNHDVSLDPSWWLKNLDKEDDDPKEPEKTHKLFRDAAETAGVRLLADGRHEFTLKDGRSFALFASPYTPAVGGYGFAYDPEEDYWSRIPDNVDVVMTHGPPRAPQEEFRLDLGHKDEHCGCPNLWKHIQRSTPRLHCFGHIHEGYGACIARWEGVGAARIKNIDTKAGLGLEISKKDSGSNQTLFVNAAILTHGEEPNNEPLIVELEF